MPFSKLIRSSLKSPAVIAVALYLVLAVVLFPAYVSTINNDGVSYLSIAYKIAAGQFGLSLSTYWGPLFSWLIAGLLALGVPGLVAAKIVTLGAGLASLLLFINLRTLFAIDSGLAGGLTLGAAILIVSFAFETITPDLLLCTVLLAYLRLVLDPRYGTRAWHGPLAGVLGGIGYLVKSFALPFFVTHILVMAVTDVVGGHAPKRRVIVSAAGAIVTCLLVAAPWIAVISARFGSFTIGQSAVVVHSSLGPQMSDRIPMYVRGLLAPPDPLAVSAWDDPTAIAEPDWSPIGSKTLLFEQLKVIGLNAENFLRSVMMYDWSLVSIFGFLAVLCLPLGEAAKKRRKAVGLASVLVLMLGLYLPLIIEVRYFWLPMLLGILAGGELLTSVFNSFAASRVQRNMALLLFLVSFLYYPIWHMALEYRHGDALYVRSMQVGAQVPLTDKRIASDRWKLGLYFSYFVDGKYFGLPTSYAVGGAELDRELLAQAIDWYVVWGQKPTGLKQYVELPIPPGTPPVSVFTRR